MNNNQHINYHYQLFGCFLSKFLNLNYVSYNIKQIRLRVRYSKREKAEIRGSRTEKRTDRPTNEEIAMKKIANFSP